MKISRMLRKLGYKLPLTCYISPRKSLAIDRLAIDQQSIKVWN